MRGEEPDTVEYRIPDGLSIIAFGDVHGCADRLDSLLDRIAERVAEFPERRHIVVSVGDLIDRGPDSARVVARLIEGVPGCEVVVLRGNHEAMMLDFIHGDEDAENWLHNGGLHTMASYGIDRYKVLAEEASLDALRRALLANLPPEHLAFVLATRFSFECGGYFFVHAGVRPGVPLDRQKEEDLIWIRDEFLDWEGDFGKRIVHGHTPVDVATFKPNRINLDTGACFGGPLTAVLIEGSEVTLF
jgi:serine/threonine protein phosphatase 1